MDRGKKAHQFTLRFILTVLKIFLSTNANPFLRGLYHKACPNPTHLSEVC
jgi:hypothetical protein